MCWCNYCKQEIDIDDTNFVHLGSKYFHIECYELMKEELNNDE